ncbi:hypothetical protein SDC9_70892 [bioreactor metagenome]|uniref:Uncharacterized protein n=1 Tax=bioreactor metagenome TaxID=1076179 RepID=A0A644Y7G5_9ZZZZ
MKDDEDRQAHRRQHDVRGPGRREGVPGRMQQHDEDVRRGEDQQTTAGRAGRDPPQGGRQQAGPGQVTGRGEDPADQQRLVDRGDAARGQQRGEAVAHRLQHGEAGPGRDADDQPGPGLRQGAGGADQDPDRDQDLQRLLDDGHGEHRPGLPARRGGVLQDAGQQDAEDTAHRGDPEDRTAVHDAVPGGPVQVGEHGGRGHQRAEQQHGGEEVRVRGDEHRQQHQPVEDPGPAQDEDPAPIAYGPRTVHHAPNVGRAH